MTPQTEALKLALEALESCDVAHITDGGHQWYDEKLVDKAITAIEEALSTKCVVQPVVAEQHKQEPVYQIKLYGSQTAWHDADSSVYDLTPPNKRRILYTTPPQRKPLTDAQREEIAKGWRGRNWTVGDIIDAIEAAHGIKE